VDTLHVLRRAGWASFLFYDSVFMALPKISSKKKLGNCFGPCGGNSRIDIFQIPWVPVIVFCFLSNWKLIKERKAWVLVFLTLILLVPHFLWQFENQFPTFRYHLVDSHQTGYKIDVTINYVLGVVLLTGPFLGWLFLYSASKYRPSDYWERALKFVFVGIFLFFSL
jgi:hypothetical protein